jgi:hypothetical protein
MMLPADIKQLIARLDPGTFNAFVGGLLAAESERLGMPPGSLIMSDAITENDGGLDALMRDVPALEVDPQTPFPAGEVGWQLKSTRLKVPSAFELATELPKPGPKRVLSGGGAYVLVSSQDLNPAQREALEKALVQEADKVMAESGVTGESARVSVWDAQTLALLSRTHPAPAAEIGITDFGQAQSLPELLRALQASDRPFQTDESRTRAVDRLRERARTDSDDPLLMTVHGDPGAGKTRAVAHALDTDDLRDVVLYVNGSEGLQVLLTRLIRLEVSRGILFVDEVDEHTIVDSCSRLGGQAGRWRIVSVTSQAERRWIPEGGRTVVLPPLDADATRRLVVEHAGLPEPLAGMVAEVAAGFPELAFSLADELRADPDLDLVRLARLPTPQDVLARAFSDAGARQHLGPIALFSAVGFEGELRYELEAIAAAFGLDPAEVERYCEAELGHFASRAGRYRMVSPLLVAIWLASDLIERTAHFEEVITGLPESLQDAFVRQLEHFGPDAPHLPAALRRVIRDDRFRRPEAFSEAAGRFLRASAAIIPSQVAEAIHELMGAAEPDDLKRIPRRDLVWTLQVLLWWPETWETAIDGLYLLAQNENETWANNATGEFVSAFTLYLSGSTVPYADRAAWLRRAIEASAPEQLTMLGNAASAGLQSFHSRARVGFQGGGEPSDWQPQTREEYVDARRMAWQLSLEARDRATADSRVAHTKQLASALRLAYEAGLRPDVAEAIHSREWSPQERAALASGLRDVLQYEDPDAETRVEIQALHDSLVGDELPDRIEVVFGTSLWDLHSDSDTIHDVPPLLVRLADDLAARGEEGIQLALGSGRDLPQQETRYTLFRLLAERLSAARVGDAALAVEDWPGAAASLSVADTSGEGEWASRVLTDLAERDPGRVPELLTVVDLTSKRLDLALDLVERGRTSGEALGRLLYGARIRSLDEQYAVRVLEAVGAAGAYEAALGMLDQWLEVHAERSARLRSVAVEVALRAASGEMGTMTEFYLKKLVEADVLDGATVVSLWEQRMTNRSGLVGELDDRLTERVLREPASAAPAIYRLVRNRSVMFGIGGHDLGLLSRLAEATSAEAVWDELQSWSEPELRWALHHMSWAGDEPDPLVRRFLTSDRLAELDKEADTCFFNTLGVVMGPYHRALDRERERALRWVEALRGTSAEGWALELVRSYGRDIEWHRQREEEEDLRFR